MTTLVTGGAGFIGSHLAASLLQRGEAVVILDNFNDYYDPALKRRNIAQLGAPSHLQVIEGDIRDRELVRDIFRQHSISRVAHLAAMANVRVSVSNPHLYADVNIMGSLNLMEAASIEGVSVFVQASTSSVYGITDQIPFIETDTADRPLAAYPATKRAAELLGHTYHNLHNMNFTALRFFNVYGPAGRPDMMPIRLMEATQTNEKMYLFNNGDIHRDWTYIDDTIDGVVAALERPLGYELVNLGCGAPISLKELVATIEALSGCKINWEPIDTPASDPPITYCNNEKARRLLDLNPKISVQEGLLRTWEWFKAWKAL
ncbi:MAG: NAD-dependent epimerase/dehydratase family protein [Chloroflexi bacterium]|nr:NAD-dependent epimerase/dehydratase family protein [Chloroflexota bacterium]